jgi:hypothetical protein
MEDYPFKERVKQKYEAMGKKLPWLLAEIDKSLSWFEKINSISSIQLGVIEQISKALDFDIIIDYYNWCQVNKGGPALQLSEPGHDYRTKKKFTLQFKVTGDRETLTEHLDKMLATMEREANKNGLTFE